MMSLLINYTESIAKIINMSNLDTDSIKIAVALRSARSALGISQQELADLLDVSKITVARVETLEAPLKASIYLRAIKLLAERGVDVDALSSETLVINIQPNAIESALARLQNSEMRRSDRKKSS
jgi:transcriptional regulator with XRE-family HTH domain